MKKKNIYVNQSQELLTLFEEAGNSAKIMCAGAGLPGTFRAENTSSHFVPTILHTLLNNPMAKGIDS